MPSSNSGDVQMESLNTVYENTEGLGKSGLSKNAIIAITVTVAAGLAIGLGVGLGVGLNKVEIVYVTEATKSTTTKSTTIKPETTTTTEPTPPAIPDTGPWTHYRLPEYVVPSHYEITLRPNLTTDDYTGTNVITFATSQATQYVVIHAHSTLMIPEDSVKLQQMEDDGSLTDLNIIRQFRWPEYEFYVIEAEVELVTGKDHLLTLDFSNGMVETIVGIYKSSYLDPLTGETKGIVASDFEPTDSRRGYPCFDEPAMKIEYTITIIHEQKHTALSNMPVAATEDIGNGINRTTFQRSVPMSTYLSCFVVGELDYVEGFSARGVPLRIYGAKYQIDGGQADHALNATMAMFDNYEELYNMNYSLPKYDQVAVPEFLAGAMENWGLVIYRETNLMWDPMESNTYYKQRVVAVIGHETVHQWFGNIVTMKWWDNIWLNEAFASYFEYRGIAWAFPEWNTEGHHVIDDIQSAMAADQSTGSHPIVVDVNTPAEITTVFDTITYQKGSSILNMMQRILGEDLFIGGLRNYLKKRQFSVATEQDLWDDIQEYVDEQGAGFNVTKIMDPWVQQLGYPVVTVDVGTTNNAVTKQEPMFTDANVDLSELPTSMYNYQWNIKLDYFTSVDTVVKPDGWLNISEPSYTFDVTGYGEWLKFNAKEQGYYRVNYDDSMWTAIVQQLQNDSTVFDEIDRCHLLDDVFNLAPAERISYTQALELTKYLDKEESYFVWDAFSSGSAYIREMLRSTEYYNDFQAYFVTKVKPIADKLGWDAATGTHEDQLNRPNVLDLAARFGDQDALGNATQLFEDWKGGSNLHPDIRSVVYRYGIQSGTSEDWEYMLGEYNKETVAGERNNLLRGLTATEDVALIDRLLDYTRDTSIIKEQDFFTCLTYISYTTTGNEMVWSWVRVNWDYLVTRFGIDNRTFGRLIPNIARYYNTELQKWEVESFFAANEEAGAGESGRVSAILQMDLNIAWMRDNADPIGEWLADQVAAMSP